MRSGVEDNNPQPGWNALLAGLAFCLLVTNGVAASAGVQSVRGLYDFQSASFQVAYDSPSRFSQGWEFQLFIDADDDATTGYWSGFDLLLRGVERANPPSPPGIPHSAESGQVYLRATAGGMGPGGWGRVIATAPFAMTDEQHLTFEVPLGVGSLTDGHFRFTFESYYEGRLMDAVYDVWTEESNDDPSGPPICLSSTSEWQSVPFGSGDSAFSAEFHAVPNDDFMSGYIALSRGPAASESTLPVIVGFDSTGLIAACDVNTVTSDYSVPYTAGTSYHFRVDVDLASDTYSVTVTPELSTSVILARSFAFCEEPAGVGLLDNWALQASSGSNQVCGFATTECLADSDGDGLADSSRGDADGNGTVDLYDYESLLDCFAGPNTLPSPRGLESATCLMLFDADGDQDVDASDVRLWMPCLTGP